ncbi:hypothetical protein ACVGV4_00025, partial [Enterobacter hormaechei]
MNKIKRIVFGGMFFFYKKPQLVFRVFLFSFYFFWVVLDFMGVKKVGGGARRYRGMGYKLGPGNPPPPPGMFSRTAPTAAQRFI